MVLMAIKLCCMYQLKDYVYNRSSKSTKTLIRSMYQLLTVFPRVFTPHSAHWSSTFTPHPGSHSCCY